MTISSNLFEPIANLRMQLNRGFDGGLSVKLGWKRYLEENMLHHVGPE